MVQTNLQQWIKHPEDLNKDTLYELRNLLARYPYYQTARLLYLKNLYLLHDITFGQELRKAAVYVADRRVLFNLIEGDKFTLYPQKGETETSLSDEPSLDRTLSLIDSFLASIPEDATSSVNLDISTDYTAYLLKEEDFNDKEEHSVEAIPLKGQELIDNFIEKADNETSTRMIFTVEEEEPNYPAPESIIDEKEEDESCFTETLAKIYIKQRRYSKALEIIQKLSLKYPKKNAYFADQIRFLEKLIINTK
ncbi:MAG: tetratricopeptide repeat protein [Bacteroides sp.]